MDIKEREISNEIITAGLLAGLAVAAYNNDLSGAIVGSLIMAAPLYVMAYIYLVLTGKQGLGGGDIKIAFIYGLYLKQIKLIYATYYITFFLAGLFLLIKKLKTNCIEKSGIPLIPFMSIGTIAIYIIIRKVA